MLNQHRILYYFQLISRKTLAKFSIVSHMRRLSFKHIRNLSVENRKKLFSKNFALYNDFCTKSNIE